MSEETIVRARINKRIEEEAAFTLAAMGLTVSDALGILLTRIAREKAFRLEPNAETIAAMQEARDGDLETVTLDELQAVLVAND